jgi:hypothetical protein
MRDQLLAVVADRRGGPFHGVTGIGHLEGLAVDIPFHLSGWVVYGPRGFR